MKTIFAISIIFITVSICFGQADTTFFNVNWVKCEKGDAKFYRIVVKDNDNFIVNDMYINNKPQMIAVCTNPTDPLNKNGTCIYFNENGSKESQGQYTQNKPSGTWIWYDNDGKDSTVAVFNMDGTKTYLRFSKIEQESQKISSDVFKTSGGEMPSFPGGTEAMLKFIVKEFKLPKVDKKNNTSGTFYVIIIIHEDGSVSVSEIKKSLSPTLDEEAIRVITRMPRWTPGRIDKKPVKVSLELPIKIN